MKIELCKNIVSQYPPDVYNEDRDEVHTNVESLASNMSELSNNEIYYTPKEQDTDQSEDSRCTKSQIHLGIREIENLKAHSFQMWKCPEDRGGFGHMPTSYIAKCHLRNTVLVFSVDNTSENSENSIYPNAVVTEINRDGLAMIVQADYILYT